MKWGRWGSREEMHYSVYNSSKDHLEGGWTNNKVFFNKRITSKLAGKSITKLIIVILNKMILCFYMQTSY